MSVIECTIRDEEAANNPLGVRGEQERCGFKFVNDKWTTFQKENIIPLGNITCWYDHLMKTTHCKQTIRDGR